jgi:hypothetical protein
MGKIYDNVTDLIGNTPLVKLNKIGADLPAQLRSQNPWKSSSLTRSRSPTSRGSVCAGMTRSTS